MKKEEDRFVCSECREELPRSKFYYEKGRVNGISGYCKECKKGRERSRYLKKKNGDVISESGKSKSWRPELKIGSKTTSIRKKYLKKLGKSLKRPVQEI